ncbi:MAG: ATP-binding protein [Proteobacteria bacterium]|nr:ATP-binding protein [Pseudomonadota bacterium]
MTTYTCSICSQTFELATVQAINGDRFTMPTPTICNDCEDSREPDIKIGKESKRRDYIKSNYNQFAIYAGVPERYRISRDDVMTDNYNQKALKNAREYVLEAADGFFLLLGMYGVGKTFIMACIVRGWILEGHKGVKWWDAVDMVNYIRKGIDEPEGQEGRINTIRKIPYLALDDFGKGRQPSEFVSETFFNIINHRYAKNLPMVITSNLTIDQIMEDYGQAVVSRICEDGVKITLAGPDRRK